MIIYCKCCTTFIFHLPLSTKDSSIISKIILLYILRTISIQSLSLNLWSQGFETQIHISKHNSNYTKPYIKYQTSRIQARLSEACTLYHFLLILHSGTSSQWSFLQFTSWYVNTSLKNIKVQYLSSNLVSSRFNLLVLLCKSQDVRKNVY